MFLVLPKLQQAHKPSITQAIASVSSFITLVVSSSRNVLNIINELQKWETKDCFSKGSAWMERAFFPLCERQKYSMKYFTSKKEQEQPS